MKRLLSVLVLVVLVMLYSCTKSQEPQLKFNDKGEFRIVQFTDLHWDPGMNKKQGTMDLMRKVIESEKPDLVILSGDVITAAPAQSGWNELADFLSSTGVPWCATMGNHDFEAEPGISKDDIFGWLEGKSGYVGSKGRCESGVGNFALAISGSKSDKPAWIIYCIDSNDYPLDIEIDGYDWIRFDQLAWYNAKSKAYTASNGGKPIPSLAYLHIPIPEYNNLREIYGNRKGASISSSRIGSGLMGSILECGDVCGMFAGHVHKNDYIGIIDGVAMGFGRTTGFDASCPLKRGGRVVVLKEGTREFSTWISTGDSTEYVYYYPSGISLQDEQTMEYLPAVDVEPEGRGVRFDYYEGGRFSHTAALEKAIPVRSGITPNISLAEATVADSMGFCFNALIDIPERGVYRFYTYSDDGSKLWIDDRLVVDNDGSHNAWRADGKVALEAGYHRLKVMYVEDYMSQVLKVGIGSRKMYEGPIPEEMLFVPPM